LTDRHIELVTITLHVGVGTFKPVTAECLEEHRMDAEWVEVGNAAVRAIERAKAGGRKVVAVGTTVVRALETAALQGMVQPYRGETSLFVRPGFQFKVVNALLTNFHLPQTTLLMLVSAFAGTGFLRRAYEEAVQTGYRFYSYGDAMLVTDPWTRSS
jgi:S-adenosylmethionine:tRNA ribosyltransferase-isomerase